MVELPRFFTDHAEGKVLDWNDTVFGDQLIQAGVSKDGVCELAQNPNVTFDGETESAFDLTEEVNAVDALTRLT